jgi:hypothetical protein
VAVVDGTEWERLRRYNVNELYREAFEEKRTNGEESPTAGTGSRVKGKRRGE